MRASRLKPSLPDDHGIGFWGEGNSVMVIVSPILEVELPDHG